MGPGDERRFAEIMTALAEAYQREATDPWIEAHWIALSDLPLSAVEEAAMRALRSDRFLPPPARLRELAGDATPADRAELAWVVLLEAIRRHGAYASVEFSDPAISAAVRSMGGWVSVCSMGREELHSYRRADFRKAYTAWADRATPERLPGLWELDGKAQALCVEVPAPYLTDSPARPEPSGARVSTIAAKGSSAPATGTKAVSAWVESGGTEKSRERG